MVEKTGFVKITIKHLITLELSSNLRKLKTVFHPSFSVVSRHAGLTGRTPRFSGPEKSSFGHPESVRGQRPFRPFRITQPLRWVDNRVQSLYESVSEVFGYARVQIRNHKKILPKVVSICGHRFPRFPRPDSNVLKVKSWVSTIWRWGKHLCSIRWSYY